MNTYILYIPVHRRLLYKLSWAILNCYVVTTEHSLWNTHFNVIFLLRLILRFFGQFFSEHVEIHVLSCMASMKEIIRSSSVPYASNLFPVFFSADKHSPASILSLDPILRYRKGSNTTVFYQLTHFVC